MRNSEYSTLSFKSNLQLVNTKSILKDHKFISFVRDPFALELLEKFIKNQYTQAKMSDIQKQEYENASLHCSFAFKDDYPWGTVLVEGKEKVVCKCLNTTCHTFSKCRSDFSLDEIDIFEENKNIGNRFLPIPKAISKQIEVTEEVARNSVDDENLSSDIFPEVRDHEQSIEKISYEIKYPELERPVDKKLFEERTLNTFISARQEEYIEASYKQRTIINAGPGTGKTWSLIQKLMQMVNSQGVEADTILVLCFSRAAVEVIENRLKKAVDKGEIGLEWRRIEIRTFDSFATYMISWVQENYQELLPDRYDLNVQGYEDRIITATRLLLRKKDMFEQYQHLIVDEVQDLVGFRAEFVLQILKILPEECGFTLLGDLCQAIYDFNSKNDTSLMSSVEFYKNIFDAYPDAVYLEFCENHRQHGRFASLTVPYRKAILDGQIDKIQLAIQAIRDEISTADKLDIRHPEKSEFEKIRSGGTIGILTRTNGQALKISTWLRNENISHALQRSSSSSGFAGWIAKVFCQYEYETVNQDFFMEAFMKVYPNVDSDMAQQYWRALLSTQKYEKGRYRTADLLHGVMKNSRDKLLFSSYNPDSDIVVSNIHRAKGREFDTVLILDDVLAALEDGNSRDLSEHKVCYVGVTRPKKCIQRLMLPQQYIRLYKNGVNRCYQIRWAKHSKNPHLSHIEVGLTGDMNPTSFATNADLQKFISEGLKTGIRLKMLKTKTDSRQGYYDLVAEDGPNIILGKTSGSFKRDFSGIIRFIYRLPETAELYEYLFPNAFSDLYVDDIVTHLSTITTDKPGAKIFEDICIWSGFSVMGFAQKENDRY